MLKRLSAFVTLGIILLSGPLRTIAQEAPPGPTGYPSHWHWPGPWHGSHSWWICPLVMLFMLIVFGVIVFLFRRSWGEHRHHSGPPWRMMEGPWSSTTHSALQTLNERFARGEIEKEEYEEKKATILSGTSH